MKNILDPHTRYYAFIHELFHSIGFPGHSPYHESYLFPLPVRVINGPLPIFESDSPIFTGLGKCMVEILYRPEILPGMSIKEAGEVLSRLKRIDKTPKNKIISYLLERKNRLENEKKTIIEKEGINYNQRMKKYIELDQLVVKEQEYLEELEEIRADYRLNAQVVQDIRAADSIMAKLVRIRRELILVQSLKKGWSGNLGELKNRESASKARSEVKRLGEEIVVLNDLLKVEDKIAVLEKNILTAGSTPGQEQVNDELRRIIRQLYTIDSELKFF
jgi:hypothetical protein